MARQGHLALLALVAIAMLGFALGERGPATLPVTAPASTATVEPAAGGTPAPAIDVAAPGPRSRSAADAVRAYGEQLLNWDPATFRRQHQRGAALTSGAAAERHRAALHDTAVAAEVTARSSGSRGQVISVTARGRRTGRYTVVAHVELFGEGSSAAPGERRYAAAAALINHEWKVIRWDPLP